MLDGGIETRGFSRQRTSRRTRASIDGLGLGRGSLPALHCYSVLDVHFCATLPRRLLVSVHRRPELARLDTPGLRLRRSRSARATRTSSRRTSTRSASTTSAGTPWTALLVVRRHVVVRLRTSWWHGASGVAGGCCCWWSGRRACWGWSWSRHSSVLPGTSSKLESPPSLSPSPSQVSAALARSASSVRPLFPAKWHIQLGGAVKHACSPNDSQSTLEHDRQGEYVPVSWHFDSDLPPPLLPSPGWPRQSEAQGVARLPAAGGGLGTWRRGRGRFGGAELNTALVCAARYVPCARLLRT